MYIDTHSHLNLTQFDGDRDEVIFRMRESGIRTNTVGVDLETSQLAIEISKKYPETSRAIVGIHPAYITVENFQTLQNSLTNIEHIASEPMCVGIGECGYDFFREEVSGELLRMQDEIFQRQIDIASRVNKSMMLHLRSKKGSYEAYDRAIDVLTGYGDTRPICQAHFYAGTIDQAKKLLELGCYISFTGVVTFSRDYDEIIRYVPVERILCETDSPYVAPVPYRGARCEPGYVQYVYTKIAEIKESDVAGFQSQMEGNVQSLWGW